MTEKDKLQQEALKHLKKHNYNGIILLPTGTGKGKIMIDALKEINPKSILYLCDTQYLRDKMIIDEFKAWGAEKYLNIMDRVCYQTACKWKDKYYDLMLADEFDASLTPKRICVYDNIKSNHRILVSATLDENKLLKAKKIAPIVFEMKSSEVSEKEILNKVQYYHVEYNLSPAENMQYLDYNKKFRELLGSVKTRAVEEQLEKVKIFRKHFLSSLSTNVRVVKWMLKNLEPRKQKILIFCGLSEQAEKLCKYTYHSKNEDEGNLNKFELGHIKTMAVVNKIDRGANIQGIKHIIHESIGQSKTRMTQRIGRGMRLEVEDTLNVFFLVPYFTHPWHGRRETVVKKWVTDSTVDMNTTNTKIIVYPG